MLRILEQWIFPFVCGLCGEFSQRNQDLCQVCFDSFPWINDRCYRCGEDLFLSDGTINCMRCVTDPLSFDRLCAIFSYEPPIRQLIARLKFSASLSDGRILAELLTEKVGIWYRHQALPDALIPMPLHLKRLRKRGFNQALELILPTHQQYQIPIVLDACVRVKATPPQAKLGEVERKKNMKNAFQIVKPLPFEHVAIIDDVVTTGSTVHALSEVLKAAGVEMVDVWCICRA
jgi:ComF family protein